MEPVAELVAAGHEVVVTHGNGPQVGNLLVKNALAAHVVPPVPLDWCGAQTQGTIGFTILDTLERRPAPTRGWAPRRRARVAARASTPTTPPSTVPPSPSAATCPRDQAQVLDRPRRAVGGPRRRRAGAASSPPRAARGARDARPCWRCWLPATSSSRPGGGGIPVVRHVRRRLARRRGRHRQGPHRRAPRDGRRGRRPRHRHRRPARRPSDGARRMSAPLGLGDPCASSSRMPPQGEFASGSMGPKVEAALRFVRSGGHRCGHHRPAPHRRRPRRQTVGSAGRSAPSSKTLKQKGDSRARSHRGPQGPHPLRRRRVRAGALIDDGVMAADRVVAIIGKTEGNGGVNDYTRIIADRAFREVLVEKGAPADQVRQVPIVWSGGTDGVISPHATIFATVPRRAGRAVRRPAAHGRIRDERADPARGDRLRGDGREGGRRRRVAMERAGITDPADVHYVQTKTPLLTIHTIRDAKSRGHAVWTEHTHESMDLSNGTTALGIAVALGEIEMPTDADIMHDRSLFSSVASCSSGVELDQAQVVVVGNARGVGGPLPHRSLGHAGRPRRRRHLGGDQGRRARPARPPALRPTCRAGSSTSSSSAR